MSERRLRQGIVPPWNEYGFGTSYYCKNAKFERRTVRVKGPTPTLPIANFGGQSFEVQTHEPHPVLASQDARDCWVSLKRLGMPIKSVRADLDDKDQERGGYKLEVDGPDTDVDWTLICRVCGEKIYILM